jgi:trehalose-phosphatase
LEHLLSAWPQIARQLRDASHILLLTDFDGTLTPITARPELANLSDHMRRLMKNLAHQRRFTLGVISGRALADLKVKMDVDDIIYAGNHGLEIEGPGIRFVNPVAEELKPILRVMHYVLSRSLAKIKGVFVENKGLSLSVHYRLAEDYQAKDVEAVVKKVVGGAETGQTRITSGKKVYEVRPAVAWDKGKAINLLMNRFGKLKRRSGLMAMYFGDDLTDEDGFRMIENYGNSVSVYIGEPNRKSSARYFLRSPDELAVFFEILLKQAKNRFK